MNSETFLAFSRANIDPITNRLGKASIEVGVAYDLAAEIDHRNGWAERDAPDVERLHELRLIAAQTLRELFYACFHNRKLHARSAKRAFDIFVAVATVLHPEMMQAPIGGVIDSRSVGRQMSFEQVAALRGLTAKQLRSLADDFLQRCFTVRVRKKRKG